MLPAGIFQPTILDWLFGGGIGTNIGASIIWGLAAGFVGYFIARKVRSAWTALHRKLDQHHAAVHRKLDEHAELHRKHAVKLNQIEQQLATGDTTATPADPPAPQ